MIYELRIYTMHPGKLEDIHRRFSTETMTIFAKHGMKVTDFWEDVEPAANKIYYVMEFADRETRDLAWQKFGSDPYWQQVKQKSEQNGPIVAGIESIFMQRTRYCPTLRNEQN